MPIQRSFTSLISEDLPATRDWFVTHLGFSVEFDSDWFVHLQAPDKPDLEVGIMRRDHEIVPEAARTAPRGSILTVVVDDVDAVHEQVMDQDFLVEAPRNLFYGQRRMLLREPNGSLVDVSSECDPDPEWLKTLS